MARSNTRIQNLTKVSTLADGDVLPTGPASGDVAKGITFGNFKTLIETSDSESITQVTGNYTQLITDDVIVIVGPAVLSAIQSSTGIKTVIVKSKLPGGDVTFTPFAGDTANGTTSIVIPAGTAQVLAPLATDWEIIG